MFNKIGSHGLGIALFLFVFVTASVLTIGFGLKNNETFDSGVWIGATPRERGRMAQDLVDGRFLVGQSRETVHQTLGMPEKNWGRVIQYRIDLGWPIKDPTSYGLQVHFDGDVVRQVKIVD